MFQLSRQEFANLRSQFVTSSWGGRRYLPHAFTEQGIAMLSTVLNSEKAIQVNIVIMRTFVKLKEVFASQKELLQKLAELENKTKEHDTAIDNIFRAIRSLIVAEEKPRRKIGFHP